MLQTLDVATLSLVSPAYFHTKTMRQCAEEWQSIQTDEAVAKYYASLDNNEETTKPASQSRKKRRKASHAKKVSPPKANLQEIPKSDPDAVVATSDVEAGGNEESRLVFEGPSHDPKEIVRRTKRDTRIWNRFGEANQKRLKEKHEARSKLSSYSSYWVICVGANFRLKYEAAYQDLVQVRKYSPPVEVDESQAIITAASDRLSHIRELLGRYVAYVSEHRKELADVRLWEDLAGLKEDQASAMEQLVQLDASYGLTASTGSKTPPSAVSAAEQPLVYQTEYLGKVRAYPGWVAPVLRSLDNVKPHTIPAAAFVLAQLAYWLKPNDTGRPRAKRAREIHGKWWVVVGYGNFEKQTPVSKTQARNAIKQLLASNIIERLSAKDAGGKSIVGGVDYGPNTVYLRLNHELLNTLVGKVMS